MTPDRGFCDAVCDRKINDYFLFHQTILNRPSQELNLNIMSNSNKATIFNCLLKTNHVVIQSVTHLNDQSFSHSVIQSFSMQVCNKRLLYDCVLIDYVNNTK